MSCGLALLLPRCPHELPQRLQLPPRCPSRHAPGQVAHRGCCSSLQHAGAAFEGVVGRCRVDAAAAASPAASITCIVAAARL